MRMKSGMRGVMWLVWVCFQLNFGCCSAGGLNMNVRLVGPSLIRVGDATVAEVVLRNESSASTEELSFGFPQAVYVDGLYGKLLDVPDGRLARVADGGFHGTHVKVSLLPHEEWKGYVVLFWDVEKDKALFHEVGRKTIRLRLVLDDNRVVLASNRIALKVRGPSAPIVAIMGKLMVVDRRLAAAVLSVPFGERSMKWVGRTLASREDLVKVMKEIMHQQPGTVSAYLARAVMIKYYFFSLLEECKKRRLIGESVTQIGWYKDLKDLLSNAPPDEYIPVISREHMLYRSHLKVLRGDMRGAAHLLKNLSKGDDYVAKRAKVHLQGWQQMKERVRRMVEEK